MPTYANNLYQSEPQLISFLFHLNISFFHKLDDPKNGAALTANFVNIVQLNLRHIKFDFSETNIFNNVSEFKIH